jgi:zinc finger CCHC domain-containing protein 9
MTRITSFGRKRTYLEAGFEADEAPIMQKTVVAEPTPDPAEALPPKKKKRIRTPLSKRDGYGTLKKDPAADPQEPSTEGSKEVPAKETGQAKIKKQGKKPKPKRVYALSSLRSHRITDK